MSNANDLVIAALETEASSDTLWSKTGNIVTNDLLLVDDFLNIDAKEQHKAFMKVMDTADTTCLPKVGENRKGEQIDLMKKSGKIKWSSWVVTARVVQNASDIWKGLQIAGYDEIFPEGEIISRYALLKIIKDAADAKKTPETPLETISRCLELVAKKLLECEDTEEDGVNQRFIEINEKHSDWRESLTTLA